MILRRTALAVLAAVAATSSFAQSPPSPTLGGASGPDEQYLRQSLARGSASLAASRIAGQKAQSDDLKEFAQFEVAEQETLADVLKSLQNPSRASATVKPPSEAEVEQQLDQRGRDELQKIKAAPVAEFDREYLEAQMNGHKELLRIQENYLNSQPSNRDLINVAKLARGMIREHLQLLGDIDTEIESGGATTGAAPGRR
jgi:putative membrane protein